MKQLRITLGLFLALLLFTGVAYPLAVTAIARAFFPERSSGSLLVENGQVVGARLIGQPFGDPRYFWGRLSATSPSPFNARSSGGSNLGPANHAVTEAAQARIDALRAADPGNDALVPVDLVTASASGLDPHISPAAAEYQLRRVARVRGLAVEQVRALVEASTEPRDLGFLGEPVVNVLLLNRSLDAAGGAVRAPQVASPTPR